MGALLTSILGGLGSTGNALGEAKTANQLERERQVKLAQQTEQFKAQQQELAARLKQQGIQSQIETAPRYQGTYRAADGKMYDRFVNPLNGEVTVKPSGGPPQLSAEQQAIFDKQQAAGRPLTPDEILQTLKLTPPKPNETEYQKETDKLKADEELRKRNPQMWRELHPGRAGTVGSSSAALSPTDEAYAQAIVNKKLTLDQLAKIMVGKSGDARRQRIADRVMELGGSFPAQLTPAAQKVVYGTDPVIKQVDRLIADIDNLGLKDNNSRGYLFLPRLNYATGAASKTGSLGKDIAGLSLGSVVEAASALQGASRSLQALQKAMEHTPNPWIDSPKLLREKLSTIRERLQDLVNDAQRVGTKSGLENTQDDVLPGEVIHQ